MQIVKYETNKNILTVGFKEKDFVVYAQIFNDTQKTKQELLQKAYKQCKKSIDYEKTLTEHSLVTELDGEEFIPEIPKFDFLEIDVPKYIEFEENQESIIVELNSITKDQYGDGVNVNVIYSSTVGVIENNTLTIPKVNEITDVVITVKSVNKEDSKIVKIIPYIQPEISVEEKVTQLETLVVNNISNQIENQILKGVI